jgi:hypothetical protein
MVPNGTLYPFRDPLKPVCIRRTSLARREQYHLHQRGMTGQ